MRSRIIALDLLKIFLAISVLFIHSGFLYDYNITISNLIVNGLSRIAVPIFFIINGNFFAYINSKQQLVKWLLRVFILYNIWMLLYAPFWINKNIVSTLITYFVGYHHLWYLNAMLFCGILLFKLKKLNQLLLFVVMTILFFIGVILQYLYNFQYLEFNTLDTLPFLYFHRNFLFFGLPFFILGYIIKTYKWATKIPPISIIGLTILGVVMILIESYLNYNLTGKGIDNMLSSILLAPLIFITSLRLSLRIKSIDSKNIALLSTSIYLVHPWVIIVLSTKLHFKHTELTLWTIPLSIAISCFLILLNRRVKYLL